MCEAQETRLYVRTFGPYSVRIDFLNHHPIFQRTDSGRQLAQAIGSADPHGWWSAFAASYTELRATTIQRARKQLGRKGHPGS